MRILIELSYNIMSKENLKKIDIEDEKEIMYFSEKLDQMKFTQKASLVGNLAEDGYFSEKIMSMVKIAEGKRAVFYSKSYFSGSKILMEYLDQVDIPYLYLNKNLPKEKINEILHKFKTNTIFLILNPVYIEGISILGAEQLHIMEPPDNYSIRAQLIGRIKRLYSHAHLPVHERHVLVYEWICMSKEISPYAIVPLINSWMEDINVWRKHKSEVFYLNQIPDLNGRDISSSPDEILYSNNFGIQKISEGIINKVYNNKKCCIKYLSKNQEDECMRKIGVKCSGEKTSKSRTPKSRTSKSRTSKSRTSKSRTSKSRTSKSKKSRNTPKNY
jgi:superfamily II DNA or RNA helicase